MRVGEGRAVEGEWGKFKATGTVMPAPRDEIATSTSERPG